jgi:hypothetical protein
MNPGWMTEHGTHDVGGIVRLDPGGESDKDDEGEEKSCGHSC